MNLYGHEVFKLEYFGADREQQAKAVWERIERDPRAVHLTVWRTTVPDRSRWFIVVADQAGDARQFDFGAGQEVDVDEEEATIFLERRLKLAADGLAAGKLDVRSELRFAGPGAQLLPGGGLSPIPEGDPVAEEAPDDVRA